MKFKVFYQEDKKLKYKIINDTELNNDFKNIIKIKEIKPLKSYFNFSFSSYDDIVDIFKELNIILNANLSFGQSIKILLKGNKNVKINKLLLSMQKSLENAIPVYKSLKQYENFIGTLPILFFELAHKNGDIKSSVDALSKILIENQNSKKKIAQALRYPMFLTITLLISVGIIFNFVIPQFEHIFSQYGGNLPQATVALLYVKNFFDKYFYIFLILLIPFAILMKYLYYKYSSFFDKIIVLHLPFFSKLYQHFIFYRFFLSLSMLVKSNYKFQVALKSTTLIINNHFILYKLNQIISIIENGSSISNAFNQANLVDNLTIRLLHTAQETNALPKILINLTSIYKQRLDDGIEHFTSAINPVFILLLSVFVLWIVLAIMLPTLNMGEVLN